MAAASTITPNPRLWISKGTASRRRNPYANAASADLADSFYDQGGVDRPGTPAIDGIAALNSSLLSTGSSPQPLIMPAETLVPPNAPVLGTISGTTFTNWNGFSATYNYNTPNSLLGDVTRGDLAFGWWGSDQSWVDFNAANPEGPIDVGAGDTNKVGSLNVAQIAFSPSGFTWHAPISVAADIDGKWMTPASSFGNGTYSVTMAEYLASDAEFAAPVADVSEALQFTVNLTKLDFASPVGSYLELEPGNGDTGGNWVQLMATGSTMPNGTVLTYATDARGNMIGRDGQITTNLDDAVLAQVGWAEPDPDSDVDLLLSGGIQSVYLPVGQQLHFAVQTGDNVIELLPDVQIDVHVSVPAYRSVSVNGAFGTLDIIAMVDNQLSEFANLAGSQRDYNQPWTYLTQGTQVFVEAKGSCWNWNTIHFVQIDVNPSTGDWSVGGVAYGDTDTFRAAVQANWDPGFEASGGRGYFDQGFEWTVSTGSGFYAPVLATEDGDIFVIGDVNVDGRNHIRMYNENSFGFEDLRADQDSDFDYNDMVVRLTVAARDGSLDADATAGSEANDTLRLDAPPLAGPMALTTYANAAWSYPNVANFPGQLLASDPAILVDGSIFRMFYTADFDDGTTIRPVIAEAVSADGLTWTPLGGTSTTGMILAGEGGDKANLEGAEIFKAGNRYILLYSAYSDLGHPVTQFPASLYAAVSTDGLHFTPVATGPVLQPTTGWYDNDAIYSPTVLSYEGGYLMLYCAHAYTNASAGGQLGVSLLAAVSPDGLNWTKSPAPILLADPSMSWMSDGVSEPSMILGPDGKYYLFFTGQAGDERAIGLAVAANPLGPWEIAPQPIITAQSAGLPPGGTVIAPHAELVSGVLRLWYTEVTPGGAHSIAYAESDWGGGTSPGLGQAPLWLGTSLDDVINGTNASDRVTAAGGDDIVVGASGNDSIDAGTGNDQVWAGPGNDKVSGRSGDDVLYLGDGADAANGYDGADVLLGEAGNDRLSGSAGNDTIDGGTEADTLDGGDDNDQIWAGSGDDNATGGLGDDMLYMGDGADTANGSDGADFLVGEAGIDRLLGDAGNDTIDGGADSDTLDGGADHDQIWAGFGDDNATGGLGDDMLYMGDGADAANGSDGADFLMGEAGIDRLLGDAGNDTIDGGTEADTLDGGADNDQIWAGSGDDNATGGLGDDVLHMGDGADTADGGDGADTIAGEAGQDLLRGGAGSDKLDGGADGDTLDGGSGNDQIWAQLGDDHATGGSGNDLIYMGEGADTADGDDGVDTIAGEAGQDLLRGGAGNDKLDGGLDSDTLDGGSGKDTLYGGTGSDRLLGGTGDDLLVGEDGHDMLIGGSDADTLAGGIGDDTLAGGAGNDQLQGDAGRDAFLFDTVLDQLTNLDRLLGFTPVDDTIQLENAIFKGLGPTTGALAPSAFRAAAGATSAGDATDRIVYDTLTGILYYDADGVGGTNSTSFAVIDNKAILTAANFTIV